MGSLPPEAVELLTALGIGPCVMLIVEVIKRLGLLPDGTAGKAAVISNIVAYAALLILGVYEIDLSGNITAVTGVLHGILTILLQIISALKSYGYLRDAEVIKPLAGR